MTAIIDTAPLTWIFILRKLGLMLFRIAIDCLLPVEIASLPAIAHFTATTLAVTSDTRVWIPLINRLVSGLRQIPYSHSLYLRYLDAVYLKHQFSLDDVAFSSESLGILDHQLTIGKAVYEVSHIAAFLLDASATIR